MPFNEAIGFTAKVDDDDPKDIDYPYFVTAHEVAHQWWAHQEVPANVQGGEFITESLSEYSALMVLKHKYGDEKMHRFLRYELDRYLAGRGFEQKGEQPLVRADGAAYVHYQKGALVLYALQDAIGEPAMGDALSAFLAKLALQGTAVCDVARPARRAAARDAARAPGTHRGLLRDDHVLRRPRGERIGARRCPAAGTKSTLVVSAKKTRADAAGNEKDVPMDATVDIGVQDAKGSYLLLEKRRVKTGENRFTVEVAGEPAKAGIDPLGKLIDRDATDNMVEVTRS